MQTEASGEDAEVQVYHALAKYSAENASFSSLTIHGLQMSEEKLDALAGDFPSVFNDLMTFKRKGILEISIKRKHQWCLHHI